MSATMRRAWRIHEYGSPLDVLQLDTVPIPEPGPGEVRVKVQAIPFNLNDLERITGGNMMVRPELPYSPGMEVMGVVDACGAGTEEWQGRRVVAMPNGANGGFAEYAICPAVVDVRDARGHPAARRGRALLPVPSRLARPLRPRRAAGRRERAHPRRRRRFRVGRDPARGARRRAGLRDRGHRREGASSAATSAPTSRSTTTSTTSPRSCSRRPATAGVDVVFDNVGEAVMEKSLQVHRLQRPLPDDGLRADKVVADEPFIVPRRVMAGELQAVRRAARPTQRRRWPPSSSR